ncbi:MAG TPA: D-cysteine desulfhydrase family protein [Anaerolineales bacterium]|nr:D-cysteine desulfhydrase family protein [Anaerolineales bacterium]
MKALPRVALALLPTPIQRLPRLTELLAGPQLSVKRDDQTGLAFGGNKTRKLETLCAAALAEGADMLVTTGSVQSNHCRQTAAAAAHLGLGCTLVLVGDETPDSGNLLLDILFGADLRWTSKGQRDSVLQIAFEETKAAGRRPYLIPYGGSNPTGAAAYAFALKEVIDQGPSPDWIVVATSSGGTQAGLLAGARMLNYRGRIIGISVNQSHSELGPRIASLSEQVAVLLDEEFSMPESSVWVNDDYLGQGYAILGDAEGEAIRVFAQSEGLLLDPVYTGRAAAGLIDLIRKGFFDKKDEVLFWHTGGTPALFANAFQKDLAKVGRP